MTKHQVVAGDTLSAIARHFYGDGRLFRVISSINKITNPDQISVGQTLEIPYVTFRHQVSAGDTKRILAQRFYHDETLSEVFEIPNGAAQRDLILGEWLVIPDLANVGHHTVVLGERWETLAERWYGDAQLWTMLAIANHQLNGEPRHGQVVIRPRLNRRHTVVGGDTLWRIVEHNYGEGGDERTRTLIEMVAATNFLANADLINVGQRLWLPSFD
ncbi:LysM peptidoglycan-binding domain-containing protein [Streptomyces sp. SID6673]|nr:LysM peptidoglycan-binding domain-containing protein [Streptomyces sp. SID11726]NEB26137.1 LysM peptidoglycan-binding domain-containing protein [Streptomyces sp. SID6673]